MKKLIIGRLFLTPIQLNRFCLTFMLSVAVVAMSGCRRPMATIAVIPRTCGTWLWEAEHTGVERAASAYGLSVYWNAPMRDDDVQGQIEILTHALDRGAKGIIISPVEALPLRTPVYRALKTGTPVVVVGTDVGLAPGRKLAYVLNDERSSGQMAARRLGSILHGHGSIAILGINKQLTSTADRVRNLEITLAEEFPQIHVVYRSLALPTVSQEQQVAEKLLVEGAHVDAIAALTEASTRGAFYALTEFNRTRITSLIGFDQNLLAPIRDSEIDSVIILNTYQMGRAAMRLMAEELSGGAAERYVIVQPQLVTRDTIDSDAVKETLDLNWFSK
jgi:ribose transport system substrate-binding protein